jgi:serine/threonine-protein phosphatase PP1 catalytic subunit
MASTTSDAADVDAIIEKLLSVRGARPGKQVPLNEAEIRFLCMRSRRTC